MNLCNACSRIDFEALRSSHDEKPQYNDHSLLTVFNHRRSCSFCGFLVAIWGSDYISQRVPNYGYCKVTFSPIKRGSVAAAAAAAAAATDAAPGDGDGDGAAAKANATVVNQLRVAVNRLSSPLLYFDFCALPMPTVHDYVGSQSSLYLCDDRLAFSRRLVPEMIDIRLAKKWLHLCRENHRDMCESPSWLGADEYPLELRVVDVIAMSVTRAPRKCRYVALSYVWGSESIVSAFQATRDNIRGLSQPGGLRVARLPDTIADAIRLVRDIGERYLWVDSLCIVQDDPVEKAVSISQLDLVYARSLFTLVVAIGEDCRAGLPRLYRPGTVSKAQFTQVSNGLGVVLAEDDGFNKSKWYTRGWTYQELQLSRRALIFYKDKMHWNCECDYWVENMCFEPVAPKAPPSCFDKLGLSLGFCTVRPRFDLVSLGHHIDYYNYDRRFTNEGDAHDAFRGILSRIEYVTGQDFHWGLPCTYFHHALLWRESYMSGWRDDSRRTHPCTMINKDGDCYSVQLPSWSWLGWYTHWYRYDHMDERSKKLGNVFVPEKTDWATKWFRIDSESRICSISRRSHGAALELVSANRPAWAGEPISNHEISDTCQECGRIVTQTSYGKLRIRQKIYDKGCREAGQPPYDGPDFDLLNEDLEIRGELHASELLRTVVNWEEEEAMDVESNGRVHDFIVISRERHTSLPEFIDHQCSSLCNESYHSRIGSDNGTHLHVEYSLNLMMIEWSATEPGVASRRSLFQMSEQLWAASDIEWKRVILQ